MPAEGDGAGAKQPRDERMRVLHMKMAATIAASALGCLLGVVSICNIRSHTGAIVIVPGAVLGILLTLVVVAIVGLLYIATGIRV